MGDGDDAMDGEEGKGHERLNALHAKRKLDKENRSVASQELRAKKAAADKDASSNKLANTARSFVGLDAADVVPSALPAHLRAPLANKAQHMLETPKFACLVCNNKGAARICNSLGKRTQDPCRLR